MYKKTQGVSFGASARRGAGAGLRARRRNTWHVECYGPDGQLKWEDDIVHNLVVTVGLNHSIQQHFKGSSYTGANNWFIGLTDGTPTFAMADTISSHGGWTEVTAYSETYRQTLTLGTVDGGSGDNSANKGTYSISSDSTTIGGAFLVYSLGAGQSPGSAVGTLYGGGAFSAGDKTLDDGDTLNVTVTVSAGTA